MGVYGYLFKNFGKKKKPMWYVEKHVIWGSIREQRICKFMIGPKYFIEKRFDPPSFKFQLQFLDSRVK